MRVHRVASHVVICCGVALLVGCAKKDHSADTTTTAMAPAQAGTAATSSGAMAPAPIALSDIAGKWKLRATPQSGTDTTATELTLTATGTANGWKFAFKNGPTVPVHVMPAGDSIVIDAGPYRSVRRKGAQVTTHGVFRKEGDKLVGTTVAHYNTKGADSMLTLHTEGVRAP
jgi:hypothetical protein